MKKNKKSALNLMCGVEQPPQINEKLLQSLKQTKKHIVTDIDSLFHGICKGDRVSLSKGITLVESNLEAHQAAAHHLVDLCLPFAGNSLRIGVTGVPGVGKSTFIEAMGMKLLEKGHRVAVLAVDPSSERSRGSILGDKTRMEHLATQKNAFIRPSPSSGTLGGVTRKTRETIVLCEAAGYDVIFVETVGVGQSEIVVKSMVDFFLLLVLAGAGDELQGIKRGIMEMADAVLIHKADGDNLRNAQKMIPTYEHALHFFPLADSQWKPFVLECSSISEHNICRISDMLFQYVAFTKENGFFQHNRSQQEISGFHQAIDDYLKTNFYSNPNVKTALKDFENLVVNKKISPYQAASMLIDKYRSETS
jgi:LAO/AO transport system kinase